MPTGLPSLNALRVFEAAARHLSFKLAAVELSVTPTAVSHQIRDLEAWFGQALFTRHTRRLELAPAGEALYPKVKEGIGCLVAAVERTRTTTPTVGLTITVPPTFASRWLVPRLGSFTGQHAEIVLHLKTSLETIDDARRDSLHQGPAHPANTGEVEAEIRYGLGVASRPGYVVESILVTDYVLVCAPALLCGAHPLREPADIRYCMIIHDDSLPDERVRPSWAEWCTLGGIAPALAEATPGPHFNDTGTVLAAVANGMGVALMARQLIGPDLADGRIASPFEISVPSVFRYYLVVPETLAGHPALRAFRDWITRLGAEDRPAARTRT